MIHCINVNSILFISSPSDYTDLAMSTVTQRLSMKYSGTIALLQYYLNQLSGDLEQTMSGDRQVLRVFKSVNVIVEQKMVIIEVNFLSCIGTCHRSFSMRNLGLGFFNK